MDSTSKPRSNALYCHVWRWHFYAGLYVIPFLLVLAVTGLMMLSIAFFQGVGDERMSVKTGTEPLPVSVLQANAEAAIDSGVAAQYAAPLASDRVAVFRIAQGETSTGVTVNPYTGEVLHTFPWRNGLYDLASTIHGSLMIGDTGDRLIEAAASLAILLIASGLYLHWPRNGSGMRAMFVPSIRKSGRSLWKSLHGVTAIWITVVLAFFLVSGLSWSGIWGGKMVQAWNTFPAEKWNAVPLSDATHASMNHNGAKEVPWTLEQTPLPESGSLAGQTAIGGAVDIDSVASFAERLGFEGRFNLDIPSSETGVWTISHDSMSNDGPDPSADRTLHIDRYTGNVLADVRYADYSAYAKAMAWGIALHEGDLGLWNFVLNACAILAIIFVCVSGIVLWWKRRPTGANRLAAPPLPEAIGSFKGALLVGLLIAMAFPMAGIAIITVLLIDLVLVSRVGLLRRAFS